MINPATFRDIVSGRRRTAAATAIRCGLRVAETPYRWAVQLRNRHYDRRSPTRLDVPVISVGNLTVGGTGKTPTVAWLAHGKLTTKPWNWPLDFPMSPMSSTPTVSEPAARPWPSTVATS